MCTRAESTGLRLAIVRCSSPSVARILAIFSWVSVIPSEVRSNNS